MTVKFGVEIEDRALFHFGAASQGAPLPSTFIAYSKRAQPASHKQCVEARRRGVLARACAGKYTPAPRLNALLMRSGLCPLRIGNER